MKIFQAPKPAKPWSGVRSAKEFGPVCYQREGFAIDTPLPAGSEDCLYINIYSPSIRPSKPLPVMFWIHGGGFIWGSGNDNVYGPEFLIRHDVILVTFNYRVGVLGFLCLDTKDVPGNAGMKDQVLALKWVNRNISKFGGDPNNITIFGESAGGSSVGFHLISPMSKGLFKRAIIQSGSFAAYWAVVSFSREKATALARQLGCYSENDKELYDFFKKQPIEKLIEARLPITQSRKVYDLDLAIVSEKYFGNERFFYGDVHDWMRKGIHEGVQVIAGYTEHEGVLGLGFNEFNGDLDKLFDFANEFIEFFVPKRLAIESSLSKRLEIGKKFKNFYIKNGKVSRATVEELINFITMDFFVYEILMMVKFLAVKNKTYLYKFTCKSERNQLKNIFVKDDILKDQIVVCHSDDLPYLFPLNFLNQKIDKASKTFQIIDNVTKLWTNFTKCG